jgi:hypothetical protein
MEASQPRQFRPSAYSARQASTLTAKKTYACVTQASLRDGDVMECLPVLAHYVLVNGLAVLVHLSQGNGNDSPP